MWKNECSFPSCVRWFWHVATSLLPVCRVSGWGLIVELSPSFPCCAQTRTSIKPDRAAVGLLVIRDRACLSICKGCYTLTSVMRQRNEIKRLPEDRHLRGDTWVFQKRSDTRRPLSAEWIAAVWREDASDNSLLCETSLDIWQQSPSDVWWVAAGSILSNNDSKHHTEQIYSNNHILFMQSLPNVTQA